MNRQAGNNKRSVSQSGFTLIELVVVIVILGILAATALPKFVDLGKDARVAKVNAMAGALRSAAELWHAACVIDGGSCLTGQADLDKSGMTVNTVYGYPNAGSGINTKFIDVLVNRSGYTVTLPGGNVHKFAEGSVTGDCYVTYTPVTGSPPSIVVATDGC